MKITTEETEKQVEPVKSKKQELSELIQTMQIDMKRLADIGQGLTIRCEDMLDLLKDLTDPTIPAPAKENHYPNYVT